MSVDLKEILERYKTVAIVGLSKDPSKDSYRVATYLKSQGFRIVPINPFADEILGEKSYKSLIELPQDIQKSLEIVDIFRPSQEVLSIVEQAIKLKSAYGRPHVVWMQLRIFNEEAAKKAEKARLTVVMDKCIMQEHKRLSMAKIN
jgi:predicted CoA-binding protein